MFDAKGNALAGDLTTFDPEFRNADWKIVRIGQHPRYVLHVVGATLDDGSVLVVGRSLSNLRRFERAIFYGFAAATAIVAVTGMAAGLTMNLLILQRVDAIATTAERIAGGDLSARTPQRRPARSVRTGGRLAEHHAGADRGAVDAACARSPTAWRTTCVHRSPG